MSAVCSLSTIRPSLSNCDCQKTKSHHGDGYLHRVCDIRRKLQFHSLLLQTLYTCEPEACLALLWRQPIVLFADVRPALRGRVGQPRHRTVTRVLHLLSRSADFSSRKRQAPMLDQNSRLLFVTKMICSSYETSETLSLHSKITPTITNVKSKRAWVNLRYRFSTTLTVIFGKYAPC